MLGKMSNIEVSAENVASHQFELLVEDALDGASDRVVIEWVEDATADEGERAVVTIDGQSVHDYLRVPMEYGASNTPELIAKTAERLTDKIAGIWDNTLEYYGDLHELDLALTSLSVSREAGYFARAPKQRLAIMVLLD